MISDTHLFKEIHEQPEVLQRLLDREKPAAQQIAQAIVKHEITQVTIAARGTSDNAGRYAKYVFGAMNGLIVGLAAPSLFTIYQRPPKFRNALVLGISQSGASPDIIAVLAEARRQGAVTAVITNEPDSPLAAQGDFVIDLHAGTEKAVAATKTYTSELGTIALISTLLSNEKEAQAALEHIPAAMSAALSSNEVVMRAAHRWREAKRAVTVGRGFNYATAFELALKLKELTYTVVEPYSSADFLHGPLAIIERDFPVMVIAPNGPILNEMRSFIETLRQYQAQVICISDDPQTLDLAQIPVAAPAGIPEWLSPLTAVIPGQLFALHLASIRGYNVDAPRSIHKVTETL
jgi:glucosamine--fructose-6-phosphate aminotransferase (isomerizing)